MEKIRVVIAEDEAIIRLDLRETLESAGYEVVADTGRDEEKLIQSAISLATRFMTGLDGIYSLLDIDHVMYLGRKEGVVAYAERDPNSRYSSAGLESCS